MPFPAVMLLADSTPITVPPAVIVRPPTLEDIEDERVLTLIAEGRSLMAIASGLLLELMADKREVVKNNA